MELKPKTDPDRKPGFAEKLDGHFCDLLEPDEPLIGVAAASQQKGLFSGGAVVLAVTDRRLIVQPLDRRGRPAGADPTSIYREQVIGVKFGRPGGSWDDPAAVVVANVATKLKLKTADGQKFRFMLMDGTGILGAAGGGVAQADGLQALKAFFGRAEPPGI